MSKSMKSVWSSLMVVSFLGLGTACGPGDMTEGDDLGAQQQPVTAAAVQKCSSISFDFIYPPPGPGDRYSCSCPAPVDTAVEVHGVDIYSYSSDICGAAVHAGAVQAATGGKVTLTVGDYKNSFAGSTRNGVKSTVLKAYQGSFTVAPKS